SLDLVLDPCERLGLAPVFPIDRCFLGQRINHVRIQGKRRLKISDSLIVVLQKSICDAKPVIRSGILGNEAGCLSVVMKSLLSSALDDAQVTQEKLRLRS